MTRKYGAAARSVFADAQAMLDRIVAEGSLRASAFGFWPANAEGDDILLLCRRGARTLPSPCCTRCASSSCGGKAAPMSRSPISWRRAQAASRDYIGAFMVTAGLGAEEIAERFKQRRRRLLGDHGQGTRRPARRSFCRAPASARAHGILGLCAAGSARRRRADCGKIPRHPAGAGISGAARSH